MRPLAQQPRAAGFFERPVWASAAERSEWKTQNDTTRRSPVPHSSSDNTFVPAPQTAQKEAVWLCPDSKEDGCCVRAGRRVEKTAPCFVTELSKFILGASLFNDPIFQYLVKH